MLHHILPRWPPRPGFDTDASELHCESWPVKKCYNVLHSFSGWVVSSRNTMLPLLLLVCKQVVTYWNLYALSVCLSIILLLFSLWGCTLLTEISIKLYQWVWDRRWQLHTIQWWLWNRWSFSSSWYFWWRSRDLLKKYLVSLSYKWNSSDEFCIEEWIWKLDF